MLSLDPKFVFGLLHSEDRIDLEDFKRLICVEKTERCANPLYLPENDERPHNEVFKAMSDKSIFQDRDNRLKNMRDRAMTNGVKVFNLTRKFFQSIIYNYDKIS
jgi:hypothetical protein